MITVRRLVALPCAPAESSRPTMPVATSVEPAPSASAAMALTGPITDARAFATLLGQIAERDGDAADIGSGDEQGDLGVTQAWVAAGWPADGFGAATPTSIDVHPLRGADTVDAFYVAYAVVDTQGRCFLGAVTPSPADGEVLFSMTVPGVYYRDCTAEVAAAEYGAIVGTINGDQA
ncbi:MAG: hypothetical protein ACKOW5_00900 [Actinomycetales bacterium]